MTDLPPVPTYGRYEWNADRVARVRAVAEAGGTAREAAIAVGLEPERDHLIYRLAKAEGFSFRNIGRKRDEGMIVLRLDGKTPTVLTENATRRGDGRRELAAKILAAALDAGPTFIDNLLDEGA